ncbi:MAG: hypothetical protein IPO40_12675 [Fibrobacteres bacterium]|nr:hypothetical protein [Fibrobacterota bacterium]
MMYEAKAVYEIGGNKVGNGNANPETLRRLAGEFASILVAHRAIYVDADYEYLGRVIKSINQLRKEVEQFQRGLEPNNLLHVSSDITASALRRFLSIVEKLSEQAKLEVESARLRIGIMEFPYESDQRLVELAKKFGTDDIVNCDRINMVEVHTIASQWSLISELTLLRIRVGGAVRILKEILGEGNCPKDLQGLIDDSAF